MSGEGGVVCVTGASGYIASWLVKLLLEHDYTVKGTVRDPNDPKKTEHLRGLDGAGERLQLFKANLVEEGSFDAVVDGCDGVFHTASPVFFSTDDPQAQIDSAVKGTLNVLKACAKFPSVKRVVITSSMASVISNGKPLTPDVEVDETWKSDADFCNSMKNYYATSKTLAEEAAWKFAEENGINVVTLHPGIVVGPLLQPIVNLSTEAILKHITGDLSFPLDKYRFVDVRDVATAHIQAFELPSASGRYCLVARVMDSSEVLKIVLDHYPALRNRQTYPEGPFPPTYKVSTVRAKTLGIDFTPVEITLIDAIENFKEKGFLDI